MRRSVLSLSLVLFLVGCATNRQITVSTRPPDASIKIDGVERGKGQVTNQFVFNDKDSTHSVTVSRLGFKEQTTTLKRDFAGDTLKVDLHPLTRRVTINVAPVAANLMIDGRALSAEPTDSASAELEFTVDARNNWTTHTLVAERPGYERLERLISWQDRDPTYNLRLEPQKKNLNISTKPPGAQVFLDGEPLGVSPVSVTNRPFPVDLQTDEVIPQKLRAVKPGYDPIETTISWEDGKQDYKIDLAAKTKTLRILTDPPGATVSIDGKALEHDRGGAATATLQFPPINERGDLRSYTALISKKTADSGWEPQ